MHIHDYQIWRFFLQDLEGLIATLAEDYPVSLPTEFVLAELADVLVVVDKEDGRHVVSPIKPLTMDEGRSWPGFGERYPGQL